MSDSATLARELEELRRQREELVRKRRAEYESINFNPATFEPVPVSAPYGPARRPRLVIEHQRENVEVGLSQIPKYTRSIQTDIPVVAAAPDVVAPPRPALKIKRSSLFEHAFDEDNDRQLGDFIGSPTRYSVAFSSIGESGVLPVAVDSSGTNFSLAYRPINGSADGRISLFDGANPDRKSTELQLFGQPSTVQFAPGSSDHILVGHSSGILTFLDRRQPAPVSPPLRPPDGHFSEILATHFTTDKTFWSIGADVSCMRWDIRNLSQPSISNLITRSLRLTAACLNERGWFIAGSAAGSLFKIANLQCTDICTGSGDSCARSAITAVDISRKSYGMLAVASLDGSLRVWHDEQSEWKVLWETESMEHSVLGCCWHPNRRGVLAAARSDDSILFCDIEGAVEPCKLGKFPTCIAYDAEGSILCAGTLDGGVSIIRCLSDGV
jgi:WD40 repeat protein